jgi:hypothetical protein
MSNARPAHYTMPPSVLNTPTPEFHSASHSLYGSRGPQRAADTGRQRKPLHGQPESIEHHIDDALARVADLTGRQRAAVKQVMLTLTRDLSFVKQVHDQLGPWGQAATDEGRLL